MPAGLYPGTKRTGVELDSISARIASKLYTDSNVRPKAFEDSGLPQNFFDVAVGNTCLVSAGTRHLALIRAGRIAPQQLAQRGRSGPMHGSPHGHLDGLQIESAGLALVLKHKPEQGAYFPFDFLTDRFRRFFSCGGSVASTGLARQIFSFTSSRPWLSSLNW
jgi:hypothetical protein